MLNIRNHDNLKEGLTDNQLKEREISNKEAKSINREIIFGIKTILFVSLIIIFSLLIYTII